MNWKNVCTIALVYALRVFGFMSVLPILAHHGNIYHGATMALLGLAIGVYGLTQAIFNMLMGFWSDRYGRKNIIYFGIILLIIGSIIAYYSSSIYGIICGRAIQGTGAIGSTLMAYLSDTTPDNYRGRAMAVVGASIGGTFWLSVLIGPIIYAHIGLANMFLLTAVLGVVALLVVRFSFNCHKTKTTPNNLIDGIKRSFLNPQLVKCNVGVASIHATFTMTMAFLAELTTQYTQWKLYAPCLVASLIISVLLIIYAERNKQVSPVIYIGTIMLACASLQFAYQYSIIVGIVLFFAGFNILEALLMATASKNTNVNNRGLIMGLYSTFQFFGIFLGGAIGGAVRQIYAIDSVFLLAFALMLCFGIVLISVRKQSI